MQGFHFSSKLPNYFHLLFKAILVYFLTYLSIHQSIHLHVTLYVMYGGRRGKFTCEKFDTGCYIFTRWEQRNLHVKIWHCMLYIYTLGAEEKRGRLSVQKLIKSVPLSTSPHLLHLKEHLTLLRTKFKNSLKSNLVHRLPLVTTRFRMMRINWLKEKGA